MPRFKIPRPIVIFILLVAVVTISCGGNSQMHILPGYHSALLKRILILPVTGMPDVESRFMTSIISKTFEAQGHYQVVVYQPGQSKQFDRIMSLSRQVNGAIPLDVIPELGRLARADAVIVTHQSTMAPVEGVIYRFESETGAIIRNQLTPRHPPRSGESSGFTPVDIFFPSGQIRMQMLEASSIQRLWETRKEIESPSALRQMIEGVPAQRGEE